MAGKIEVITGPMFAGKTTEVLRRLERYALASKSYLVLKPATDTRGQTPRLSTVRGTIEYEPLYVERLIDIQAVEVTDIIVLEEAQFFGQYITAFCRQRRDEGKTIIVSGLDMDAYRRPFGYMGNVMAIADSITKLTAICKCGSEAIYTKKIAGDPEVIIEIGDRDLYMPCCPVCYRINRE